MSFNNDLDKLRLECARIVKERKNLTNVIANLLTLTGIKCQSSFLDRGMTKYGTVKFLSTFALDDIVAVLKRIKFTVDTGNVLNVDGERIIFTKNGYGQLNLNYSKYGAMHVVNCASELSECSSHVMATVRDIKVMLDRHSGNEIAYLSSSTEFSKVYDNFFLHETGVWCCCIPNGVCIVNSSLVGLVDRVDEAINGY